MIRQSAIALALFAAASTTACAVTTAEDGASASHDALNEATTILEAKMYGDPDAKPNAMCDVHTAMTLRRASSGTLSLELEERVVGGCELFVEPNKRAYPVVASESCGSRVYKGKNASGEVELGDHRSRLCEDGRPAALDLVETYANVGPHYLFGAAPQSAPSGPILDVKLYDKPNAQPDAFCDVHTHVSVSNSGGALSAQVENRLFGACELYVEPDPMTFAVTASKDGCGTTVYAGTNGVNTLRIEDHTARLCEDLRPARVEVELVVGGRESVLYSTTR